MGSNGHMDHYASDGTTSVGSLDMANGNDRTTLRSKRWGTTQEQRDRYLKSLDIALSLALAGKDQRAITSCIKTIAMLEGQNQADEHLETKHGRLDGGLLTESVRVLKLEFDDRA